MTAGDLDPITKEPFAPLPALTRPLNAWAEDRANLQANHLHPSSRHARSKSAPGVKLVLCQPLLTLCNVCFDGSVLASS